jgi:hypothetical protein
MSRLPDPADIQRGLTIALFVAATWSSPPSSPTPKQRPTASRCYASRAIAAAFAPAKLNYDILGNSLPHLHTHIAPRYADDPRPGWPFPFPGTEPPMPEDRFDAPQAQYHPPRVDSPHRRNASQGSSGHAHRLLVYLPYDRCLTRLGLGARTVALNSASHAGRVALFWPAQFRGVARAGRGSRGVCSARSSGALPARQPWAGSSIGGRG